MSKINEYNRPYHSGKNLSEDLRHLIIQDLLDAGGNIETGKIPRNAITDVSKRCRVSRSTVRKTWHCYTCTGSVKYDSIRGRPVDVGVKINEEDKFYIKFLVTRQPSIYRSEVRRLLYENSNSLSENNPVSIELINHTIRHKLGPKTWTRKKLQRSNTLRWTDGNVRYMRTYLDTIRTLDPYDIRFFDECHFWVGVGNRLYGSAPCGERAVEVSKHPLGPSYTLFYLCGLNNKTYAKVTLGPSTSDTFISFISEAYYAYDNYGDPVIPPGTVLVGDNCSLHRFRSETILQNFLGPQNISFLWLARYSCTDNPVEEIFGWLKTKLKQKEYQALVQDDLPTAVLQCLTTLTSPQIYNFFKNLPNNYLSLP